MKNRKRNNLGQFVKNSKVSEFGFVNLSTYTSPEIEEVQGKEWIQYGADNNYFQFLIDRYNGSPTNNAAINGISQQIYGKGLNSREWIYVSDHCEALFEIYLKGKIGQFYNIGSNKNLNNLEVSKTLLNMSKKLIKLGKKVKILFIKDRPGHDIRYALNSSKIKKELNWRPKTPFNKGIRITFEWYKNNRSYYKSISKKDIIKRLGK